MHFQEGQEKRLFLIRYHTAAPTVCASAHPPTPRHKPLLFSSIYLFSSCLLDINFPESCHNMSSWGIPRLQQNDLVSMKWMDKEIKDKDSSPRFFRASASWQRSPDSDFHSVASVTKIASLQVKAAFVCSIHLHFLHWLMTLLSFSSRCLCRESASGGRSVESPPSRNSCHKLRSEAEPEPAV